MANLFASTHSCVNFLVQDSSHTFRPMLADNEGDSPQQLTINPNAGLTKVKQRQRDCF